MRHPICLVAHRKGRCIVAALSLAASLVVISTAPATATAAETGYDIYPTPHSVTYTDGETQTLRDSATTVVESGIDADTVNRLNETLALKGISATESDKVPTGKKAGTSVLVGIKDSDEAVDEYVDDQVAAGELSYDNALFTKTDAYLLITRAATADHPDQIIVLGESTDAAYYGLSSLYLIFQQLDGAKLKSLQLEDYADVVTRGFIEGYYGSPWSTDDRVELMKWGGHYKLNAYIYAPKDDPKHNEKWRELYTEEELETKIKPLAVAGNESKCRFVYALHPFMEKYDNPMNDSNYDQSLADLKAKYLQVIDAGVRQIAILRDDITSDGNATLCKRVLTDLTDWIHELQQQKNADGTPKYEGLKDTIIFCPKGYMWQGESWYAQLPENIQVINTGGTVWGKVTSNFVTNFTNTSGRAPFMWINWPCTDNTRDSLSMGGYENALGLGVTPGSVEGIVVNPMQQSEPSKVGIFMNADYSWHMWQQSSYDYADSVWEDAFSYADTPSSNAGASTQATAASNALRELSKHMKLYKYNSSSQTYESRESEEIKPTLDDFRTALSSGNVTADQMSEMREIFETLQDAAATYRANAGNTALRDQIEPWLGAWDDITAAMLADLDAYQAYLDGDTETLIAKASEGSAALAQSKTHDFDYKGETKYAALGNRVIMPTLNALDAELTSLVASATDPTPSYEGTISIENQKIATGQSNKPLTNVNDGNKSTYAWFQSTSDDTTKADASVILTFTKRPQTINTVTFVQGSDTSWGSDRTSGDVIADGALEYKNAEGQWVKLADVTSDKEQTFTFEEVEAYAIRVRNEAATEKWWMVTELSAGYETGDPAAPDYTGTVSINNQKQAPNYASAHPLTNINDGNKATYAWLQGNDSNPTVVDADVTLTFTTQPQVIDTVTFVQGSDTSWGSDRTSGDVIADGALEYKNAEGQWVKLADVTSDKEQTFTFEEVEAYAIRVRNEAETAGWWMVTELSAGLSTSETTTGDGWKTDGEATGVTVQSGEGTATATAGTVSLTSGQYFAFDLGNVRSDVDITAPESAPANTKFVYSQNGLDWEDYPADETVDARYVGLMATGDVADLDLADLAVSYSVIGAPSQVGGTINLDDASKVFDGDFSTIAKSSNTGYAQPVGTIVLDLGQERTISSMRYYIAEAESSYIRHAVIEVSDDPDAADDSWTTVVDIDSNGTDSTGDTPADGGNQSLFHDGDHPGYYYAESASDFTPVTARYVRVRITKAYSGHSIGINEIQINGGEYVSTYADADFTGDVAEVANQLPSHMIDGDVASAWTPEADEGTVTYHVSAPLNASGTAYQGVRIVSSGALSGATVKAVVYENGTSGDTTEVELGSLDQAVKEFAFNGKTVKNLKFSWADGAKPTISEIFLMDGLQAATSKEALQTLYNSVNGKDTSSWTTSSATAFGNAFKAAAAALQSNSVTQDYIDQLVATLTAAAQGEVRYTERTLDDLGDIKANNGTYSAASYQAYADAYKAFAAALADTSDLSDAKGKELDAALTAAEAALAYDTTQFDYAQIAVQDAAAYQPAEGQDSIYTTESYKAFTDKLAKLNELIAQGSATASPSDFATARKALQDAEAALVDASELRAALAKFDGLTASAYEAQSYQAYKKAADGARGLLKNGTAKQIADAVKELAECEANLELAETVDLDAVIADAEKLNADDYTTDSWAKLVDAVAAAKAADDSSDKAALAQGILDARAGLVDVTGLKAAINQAGSIDRTLYTADSLAKLDEKVAAAQKLLASGTVKEVADARKALLSAIDALETVATDPGEGPEEPGGDNGDGGSKDDNNRDDNGNKNDGNKDNGNGGQNGGGKGGSKDEGLPGTGDASGTYVAVAVAGLAAVAGGAAIARKRRS